MAALQLSPRDVNYLTSNLLYNQLTQNAINLEVDDVTVESVEQPQLVLDGAGRAYLSGKVKIIDASPAAGMKLFSFPKIYSVPQDYFLPVAVTRGTSYVANTIGVAQSGSSIESVAISNRGAYTTNIVPALAGPGRDATLVSHMRVKSVALATAGTAYVPAQTLTLAGGTFGTRASATVTTTKVVSATVAAGGSGGTDGTRTVTGTTGTGTKFQASVTVATGAITAVLSITVEGAYTVNPTSLTAEPVTGASLTGAQLNVVMGVDTVTPATLGDYTSIPSNPVSQFSTTGSGTGFTGTVTWELLSVAVTDGGEDFDSTSTISFTGTSTTEAVASLVIGSVDPTVDVNLMTAATQDDIVNLNGCVFFLNSY